MATSQSDAQAKEAIFPFSAFVLKVDTEAIGWQKMMTKVLKNIQEVSNFRLHEDGFIEISCTVDPKQVLKVLPKIKNLKLVEWKFGGCSSNLYTSDVYPQFDDDYYPDRRYYNNGGNYYEHGRHFQYGLPRHQDYHPTRHFQPGAYYNQPRYVYRGPYLEQRPIEVAGEPDTQPESAVSTTVPSPKEKKCASCCNVM